MPDFTFDLPDGRSGTVTAPEGTTPEQAYGYLQQQMRATATSKPQEPAEGRTASGYAQFALGNIAKGAASTIAPVAEMGQKVVDAPEMVINYLANQFGKGPVQRNVQAPTTAAAAPVTEEGVNAALQKTAPGLLAAAAPKTPTEKYAAAALQALPTAIGGEGSLARRAVQAAGSGIGAQVGGDVAGPAGAVAGAILGGGLAGGVAGERAPTKPLSETPSPKPSEPYTPAKANFEPGEAWLRKQVSVGKDMIATKEVKNGEDIGNGLKIAKDFGYGGAYKIYAPSGHPDFPWKVVGKLSYKKDGTMENIAVSPDFQRQGLAQKLIQKASKDGAVNPNLNPEDLSQAGANALNRFRLNEKARQEPSKAADNSAAAQSKRTGIPLTLGQESGSKPLTAAENILGKSVLGSGTSYADKVRQATAGVAAVTKLADRFAAEPQNAEDLGRKLQTALTSTVKHYDDLRSADAARDYGAVRALAQDRPVIKYDNTVNALNKIIDETRNVPSGESKRIYNQAIAMRDDLVLGGQARTFKVDDAMRTRRTWGAAARGTGNVFTDVDPNLSRQFAGRLFGAINQDFEAASKADTPIAQALAKANKRYGDYSKSIDYVRKSALGNLVGEDVADAAFTGAGGTTKAPELMANRFMTLQPSQARQVTNILRRNSPQVLEDTKAYVLRDMLEKASNTAPGQPPMSFDRFLTQYKKIEPKLREMGFTPKDLADIRDVTDTMARAAEKEGTKPSGASQGLQIAALALHPAFIVPNYVAAKALLTPQGRALLRRAYAGASRTIKYQAGRSLMAAYGEERNRQQQQQQGQ